MLNTYTYPEFDYICSPEQKSGEVKRHPVVVIGAGPIGLTAALDCAARDIDVVVLDDNNTVSIGSRAVCYAKRPLEIWDRLGCAERMTDKGVNWKKGKVFFKEKLAYQFDLLAEDHHKMPAMINLQQYYLEEYMVDQCNADDKIDLRWKHKLISITQHDDYAELTIETPDGIFKMEATWVIGCDGANSDLRNMLGAEFTGQFFQDRFLIADIVMKADFPAERWFWFDPPFHPNQSVLLHMQSDNVWRIDFQLGWDSDPAEEKKPENIIPRVKAMLGDDVEFELEWASVYQFACRRIDNLRYGRVLFAGDSAHQVSPFGARGANTGVQDIDNLSWKLKLVLDGDAPESLIDSYDEERAFAADDNLLNSTRSTDFITPKSKGSRFYRDAVLELAELTDFAKPLVNSGRLSTPTPYVHSSLNSSDVEAFKGKMVPGTNCADAPISRDGQEGWLLNQLGEGFVVLTVGSSDVAEVSHGNVSAKVLSVGTDIEDVKGVFAERYDAKEGTTYLIRPDQHVAARWRGFDEAKIKAALACSIGER
ncbi:MAG: FAD-dependent oxidoreductase [Cohaesibacter sp.]|nr:FAD-dependent oxidoreductase [Cohaesibacter sp.]